MPAASARSRKFRNTPPSKKYCVMARVAPASSLRLRLSRSCCALSAVGWRLRIGGDRDLEIRDALEPGDQVGRVGVALRMRGVALAGRRVAPQRHDVAHAGVPVLPRDVVHLSAAGADAGEVRGRRQRRLRHDAADGRVGARLRAAAGAVGDGDEPRGQAAPAAARRSRAGPRAPPSSGGRTRTTAAAASRAAGPAARRSAARSASARAWVAGAAAADIWFMLLE